VRTYIKARGISTEPRIKAGYTTATHKYQIE
jgi:hypothetical protein